MAALDQGIFNIEELHHEAGAITATLGVNSHSNIFDGHFPGQPVVPGACMMQLVKDLVEDELGCPLLQISAPNIKFMEMITPGGTSSSNLAISYSLKENSTISVNAKISANETACFKMQAIYKMR